MEEAEDEQGLAHVVEHVTFLGSKKREGLLGTGARSNAYTDFHHTVFHVHAPLHNVSTGQPMVPEVGGLSAASASVSIHCAAAGCLMQRPYRLPADVSKGSCCSPAWLQVLDALSEIAFNPDMLVSRLDKERKAVLAEAQMMNTIEYRVDCQLLQYLHEENLLGYRFPIGKTDQACCAAASKESACLAPSCLTGLHDPRNCVL